MTLCTVDIIITIIIIVVIIIIIIITTTTITQIISVKGKNIDHYRSKR